jgi:vancomycin resistance protein YoaR
MLRHLFTLTVFLALLGIGGVGALWASIQVDEQTLPGLRVAGEELPPTASPTLEIERRMEAWLDRPITIRAGDHEMATTRRAMGVRVDARTAADRALALGRSGDVLADLEAFRAASQGELDIVPEPIVNRRALTSVAALFRQYVEREARPARFDFDTRMAEPHVDGVTIDVDGSVDVLVAAVGADATEAELLLEAVLVPERQRLPEGLRLDTVLASFRTRYRGWGKNHSRAHNVELATERLHGAIIPAGGSLSFNERVGERTRRAGFRRAKVISGGELVDGMGGGVCQVASTLHAAALVAGMEMVEYRPHSRPSTYIPMGLDATVVYPSQDLEIQNPFDFPIAVYAEADEGELEVELVGASSPREVEIERRVLGRRAFGERIVEDPTLARGTRIISQEGIRGVRLERIRIVREGEDTFADYDVVRYPPTDRIIRVGTGPAPTDEPAGDAPLGAIALR